MERLSNLPWYHNWQPVDLGSDLNPGSLAPVLVTFTGMLFSVRSIQSDIIRLESGSSGEQPQRLLILLLSGDPASICNSFLLSSKKRKIQLYF